MPRHGHELQVLPELARLGQTWPDHCKPASRPQKADFASLGSGRLRSHGWASATSASTSRARRHSSTWLVDRLSRRKIAPFSPGSAVQAVDNAAGTIDLKIGNGYVGPLPAALVEGARSRRGNCGSG